MSLSAGDRSVIRRLTERVAEIAALPVHHRTVDLWTRLNRLERVRPLVWVDEIPWHEMGSDPHLRLLAEDPFCRRLEQQLRRTIYQWEHVRCDGVVEPVLYSPLAIRDSGFGIREEADMAAEDRGGGIVSRGFIPQIRDECDLDKIKTPHVELDAYTTDADHQRLINLVGDIVRVEKRGIVTSWFAPWDQLVSWWGVQEALTDLVARPGMVHEAMRRLTEAWLGRLRQWEALGTLTLSDGNYRVGSGGLGYTDELPQPDFEPQHVRPLDQWGFATAQIFSEVSPAMHEEFALQYECRWLKHFGLTYYGCCEPLHDRMTVIMAIPNLRKVSASPWADVRRMAEATQGRYVLSIKPNPAIFADDRWNPARARAELERAVEAVGDCPVEIIMKDISTIRREPHRLWAWAEIAMDVARGYEQSRN